MEFKITLDREAFKVLASDTRLDILKALDERPMTVSELGRKLELNKATVFEHLEKLVGAGLIKKNDDEERKWVYYALSWKGRRILHPERVTIALLFSTALGALLSGVVVAMEYLRPLAQSAVNRDAAGGGSPENADQAGTAAAPAPMAELRSAPAEDVAAAAAQDPFLLYAAILLFVTVAVLGAIGLWYWRQAKAREAREARETGAARAP